MLRWLIGIILGEIICESSNWQHIQRLKITILGANWQLFRLERIAKCSYFILSTQNIKFYSFVMKIKKSLLPIWWYNRGLFPLGNKYFGVFVLKGLSQMKQEWTHQKSLGSNFLLRHHIFSAPLICLFASDVCFPLEWHLICGVPFTCFPHIGAFLECIRHAHLFS